MLSRAVPFSSKAQIFVTGGAGFIGSAFVSLALKELSECSVINFDALTYAGNFNNVRELDPGRHKFIRGDMRDRGAVLEALLNKLILVVEFAAESHVDRSITSATEFIATNVLGTQVLLNCPRFTHLIRSGIPVRTDSCRARAFARIIDTTRYL